MRTLPIRPIMHGWLWLVLLGASWAVGASADGTQPENTSASGRGLLQSAEKQVMSPDVPLQGVCSADIMQHCKHIFIKNAANAKHANKGKGGDHGHISSAAKQADAGTGSDAQGSAVAASQGTSAATQPATSTAAGAASARAASPSNSSARSTQQQSPQPAGTAAAATGTPAPAVTTPAAAAGSSSNANTTTARNATTTAAPAAAATSGAANGTAASGSTSTAAPTDVTSSVKTQTAPAAAGGGNSSDSSGAVSPTTNATSSSTQTPAASRAAASNTTTAALPVTTTAAPANTTSEGTSATSGTNTTSTSTTASNAAAALAAAAVAAGSARHLLAEAAGAAAAGTDVAGTSANASVVSLSDPLSMSLQLLGLQSSWSAQDMVTRGSAPIARCLRGVMHASEMSISPDIPDVTEECKQEVRSVLVSRASDVRLDPPLLATCAYDIAHRCAPRLGSDTGAVLGCLKASKPLLQPQCRIAVTQRQAAAAEDLSLDPDLQRACGAERRALCGAAGWGGGAAQACLLGHLRGSLPQIFSEVIFPEHEDGGDAGAVGGAGGNVTAAAGAGGVELSGNCSVALVQRLIEEGEDVRFNYRLSSSCAASKQLLCRDVRPGGAAVLRCLEAHLDSDDMQEECREALLEVRQVRSLDVRLDHTFVTSCGSDVRSLCDPRVGEQLGKSPAELPFGVWEPFECLRGQLELVRDATCRRHLYESVAAAYDDNRLDAGLMRGCHGEIAVLCSQHPARALECLQAQIDKFSRSDSPAMLKGKVSDGCLRVVVERRRQAATDVAFLPHLREACTREHATFCATPGLEGIRGLDCLVDHRASPGFSGRCGGALRDFLARAAADVRGLAGLQRDCAGEIHTLCKGVQPGEGRVVGCLREQRGNISSEGCRGQVVRLMGLIAEDHRLDVGLAQACGSDIQKYCAGVEAGDGQVHACLRRSWDHLAPGCREAEERVEQLEHEDVRLNPALMRECPVAISSFCSDVPPGASRVISCLQSHMGRGHFPPACRVALAALTDRAATKYSLNYRLRQQCEQDVQQLCADAVDEAGASAASLRGTGGAASEETALACLARQAGQLAPGCKAELQTLVKLSLSRYRIGMPLTSQCDGDVMARCQVDKIAAPFLESGYVLSCLARHAAQLHKPCWELVASMDDSQFKRAAAAETTAVTLQSLPGRGGSISSSSGGGGGGGGGGGVLDEATLQRLVGDVRRELEPRLYTNMEKQVAQVHVVARNVSGELLHSLAPRVSALLHATMSLLVLLAVGLA
ncbi:hypothetical protein Agub_g290, partial [Astrephomene gubernaculifera]